MRSLPWLPLAALQLRGCACVVCAACRALVQPLCAILGGLLSERDHAAEGPAAGVAAAARVVAPIRTAETILACLHAIFEREDVSEPSQARLGCSSPGLLCARYTRLLTYHSTCTQVLGVLQLLVLVFGLPLNVRCVRYAYGSCALS